METKRLIERAIVDKNGEESEDVEHVKLKARQLMYASINKILPELYRKAL